MKESYAWNMYMCYAFLHFYNLSAQFSFSFEILHTNARESLEEHEMPSEHKPETSVLTTFFELS